MSPIRLDGYQCEYTGKDPVTELFNFKAPRDRRKTLIFLMKKGPVTASLQRPYSDHGISSELAWRSIAYLRSSCWRFSALLRRFHGVHNACTALSWRSHCADGVLKMQ